MAGAMLLMTGCSADDVVIEEITSKDAVAISFSCNYDDEGVYITKAGHEGAMNTEDLHTTGFGAMASVTADKKPTLMYNQEVAFTLVGDLDDPKKGYWSYAPKKYWPTDLTDCYISAYAPYMSPDDLAALAGLSEEDLEKETGIIGISANNEAPYIDYRRCEKPSEVVDLLWYYEKPSAIPAATALNEAGTLAMKMRHALARLDIKVALAAAPASGTKVLVEEITLTGNMAKTGRLSLCSQEVDDSGVEPKYYPIWTDQTYDDHTFQIKNITKEESDNPETFESYGIIESQVRYIPNLPYGWQPAGLSTTPQDALNTGDRKGYVYLIPQGTLSLKINVKYHVVTEAGADTPGEKSIDASPDPTPITISPLRGNTTYSLKITLSEI
jgi:hypothetical protein